MAKKKRYRGHYCKVCSSILANEKFSGGGHSRHICKKCSKLSVEQREEIRDINKIYSLFGLPYITKAKRVMLEKYLNSNSEKVRSVAKDIIDEFEETERLMRIEEELLEEEYGIDPGNDEFLDDYEDDDYFDDLHMLEGKEEFDIDGDGDELPF